MFIVVITHDILNIKGWRLYVETFNEYEVSDHYYCVINSNLKDSFFATRTKEGTWLIEAKKIKDIMSLTPPKEIELYINSIQMMYLL